MIEEFDFEPITSELVASLSGLFSCHKDPDVMKFFSEQAINFSLKNLSKTFLIKGHKGYLGFFTLSQKSINIDAEMFASLSKTKQKSLASGFHTIKAKRVEQGRAYTTFYLIAQLAKNELIEGNPLTLNDILGFCYDICREAQQLVGGKLVLVECKSSVPKLRALYESHGYTYLGTDERNDLDQLFISL